MEQKQKILLTGATGCVGAKLLKELEYKGCQLNCLTRNPGKLKHDGPHKRTMLPISILSPKLSSHRLAFITQIDPVIGSKLIEGIRSPTLVESARASELFDINPASVKQAMAEALAETPFRKTLEGLEYVYAA